jgi:hypothetical protein
MKKEIVNRKSGPHGSLRSESREVRQPSPQPNQGEVVNMYLDRLRAAVSGNRDCRKKTEGAPEQRWPARGFAGKAAIAPVVIADPIGVWWGLRSSADGKGPGLPVLVLGGDYADAPLEASAGEIVARMLVEERLSAVLDLSKFRKNEQTQFMTAFAERLYHDNREALHLMLDEADAFAPQKPYKGQERLLGAIEDLVRRGRVRKAFFCRCSSRSTRRRLPARI